MCKIQCCALQVAAYCLAADSYIIAACIDGLSLGIKSWESNCLMDTVTTAKNTAVAKKPRVLVVDDERVIADTLAVILNLAGFEASAVYTGEGAVDEARRVRPDLIISDVIMPGMNGIQAAIHVRDFLPSCKILLFSGQAATADLLESARSMGHEFEILAKPVHPQDLLAKLRE